MPPLLFQSKYDVFEEHYARLRDAPDPVAADRRFRRRLRTAQIVNGIRFGLYVVAYFGLAATAIAFTVQFVGAPGVLGDAVRVAGSVSSTMTVAAIAGVLVCGRYLGLAEVDLYFFSMESRMTTP